MIKHLKERRQSEEGFTLIELMVVVLIMGILMAIAIPTFLATQGSAHDTAPSQMPPTPSRTRRRTTPTTRSSSLGKRGGHRTIPSTTRYRGGWAPTTSSLPVATGIGPKRCAHPRSESKSGNCYYIDDTETGTNSLHRLRL